MTVQSVLASALVISWLFHFVTIPLLCVLSFCLIHHMLSVSVDLLTRAVIKRWGPRISLGYFHRKIEEKLIEPKEISSCFIPRLLVVFTRQLEILVTSLLTYFYLTIF